MAVRAPLCCAKDDDAFGIVDAILGKTAAGLYLKANT